MVTGFLRRLSWMLLLLGALVLLVNGAATGQAQDDPELTVTVSGPGLVVSTPDGIDCGPNDTCAQTFSANTSVRLTAAREDGVVFTGWSGACSGSDIHCDLELTADAAVTADFALASPEPPPEPPPVGSAPSPPIGSAPPPPIGSAPPPRGNGGNGFGSPLGAIDRELERLEFANIAFNAPTSLRLGEATEIQLLLSPERTTRQLQDRLTAIGDRVGARIRATNTMEARLTGRGFEIEAITSELQAVGRGVTQWRWEIEPTKTGTRRLHLTLSAIIDVDGTSVPRTIRVFDQTLEIRVTWFDRLSGFIGQNWQWLWTTILAPLFLWLYATRKRWLWRLRSGPPSPSSS